MRFTAIIQYDCQKLCIFKQLTKIFFAALRVFGLNILFLHGTNFYKNQTLNNKVNKHDQN